MTTSAVVLVSALLTTGAVLPTYQHKTPPHAWLKRGWRGLRFGMGPGDVAARIRVAPGTRPFAPDDANTMYWSAVLADPLAGKLVEARFEFYRSHLNGIYLKRALERGNHPLYDEMYAWFTLVKSDLARTLGQPKCTSSSDDNIFCYWPRPGSDTAAGGISFGEGKAGFWEVHISFKADDEESAPWLADAEPDPFAQRNVKCLVIGCNQLLVSDAEDAALSMACTGIEPFHRMTCRFAKVTVDDISDSELEKEIRSESRGMPLNWAEKRQEACVARAEALATASAATTSARRRVGERQARLASAVCDCTSEECVVETLGDVLPAFVAECGIRVSGVTVEMVQSGRDQWDGTSESAVFRRADHFTLVKSADGEDKGYRVVWSRAEPGREMNSPIEKTSTTWSTTGSKAFMPRCGYMRFEVGY